MEIKLWVIPRIELGTSRTLSENYTTKPNDRDFENQFNSMLQCCFNACLPDFKLLIDLSNI